MKTRDQVIVEVGRLACATSTPLLSGSDIESCVDACQRAVEWSAGIALVPGQHVVPPASHWNGRVYRVSEGGTTGTTEPDWPTERASYMRRSLQVESTNALAPILLIDAGPAFSELYDIRGAIGEAWLIKAGKAAGQHAFSISGSRTEADQIFAHCVRMAKAYGRIYTK